MMRKTAIMAAAVAALVVVVALVCGCGGGGGGTPGSSTGVSGYVVDADTQTGIGNMVVTAGGASGISDAARGGAFFVPAPPGHHLLQVQPSDMFIQAPGIQVYVDVVQGRATALPAPVIVIKRGSLPPGS
ncbi:MAG: hypothetical protein GX100_10395 [candidate division WS1 bacterium]|nr:hypothetical protein [candidate division WS1 bacterium]